MDRDYRVTIIFIWLLVLTFIMIYGIMNIDNNKHNIRMKRIYHLPPIESLEVDIQGD